MEFLKVNKHPKKMAQIVLKELVRKVNDFLYAQLKEIFPSPYWET